MTCKNCGAEVSGTFCSTCGQAVEAGTNSLQRELLYCKQKWAGIVRLDLTETKVFLYSDHFTVRQRDNRDNSTITEERWAFEDVQSISVRTVMDLFDSFLGILAIIVIIFGLNDVWYASIVGLFCLWRGYGYSIQITSKQGKTLKIPFKGSKSQADPLLLAFDKYRQTDPTAV